MSAGHPGYTDIQLGTGLSFRLSWVNLYRTVPSISLGPYTDKHLGTGLGYSRNNLQYKPGPCKDIQLGTGLGYSWGNLKYKPGPLWPCTDKHLVTGLGYNWGPICLGGPWCPILETIRHSFTLQLGQPVDRYMYK
jgi:hypothetical protein